MSDLISREEAINALVEKGQSSKRYKIGDFWELNLSEIKEALDAIPFAEPEQKGEWLDRHAYDNADYAIDEWQTAQCSVCGKYHTTPYMYNFTVYKYCPNCGSKMTRGE